MDETIVDQLNDWPGFFNEIQSESPRASVIIAGAFLDAQLSYLIYKSLLDDPKNIKEKLVNDKYNFGTKITMAFSMELINKSVFHDLDIIRQIRNVFAHEMHGFTFDDPKIIALCDSLVLAKAITNAIPSFSNTHGTQFLLGVSQLVSQIGMKIIEVEQAQIATSKNNTLD